MYICIVKLKLNHIRIFVLAVFILATHLAIASFTGNNTDKRNKYSLKNLTNTKFKRYSGGLSVSAINNYRFIGIQDNSRTNNTVASSFMRYEKGNTTFVFPYKYQIKTPKFATPQAPRN